MVYEETGSRVRLQPLTIKCLAERYTERCCRRSYGFSLANGKIRRNGKLLRNFVFIDNNLCLSSFTSHPSPSTASVAHNPSLWLSPKNKDFLIAAREIEWVVSVSDIPSKNRGLSVGRCCDTLHTDDGTAYIYKGAVAEITVTAVRSAT